MSRYVHPDRHPESPRPPSGRICTDYDGEFAGDEGDVPGRSAFDATIDGFCGRLRGALRWPPGVGGEVGSGRGLEAPRPCSWRSCSSRRAAVSYCGGSSTTSVPSDVNTVTGGGRPASWCTTYTCEAEFCPTPPSGERGGTPALVGDTVLLPALGECWCPGETIPSSRSESEKDWLCENAGVAGLPASSPCSSACPPRCPLLPKVVDMADDGGYWESVGVSPGSESLRPYANACEGERFLNFQRARRYEPRRPIRAPRTSVPMASPAAPPGEMPAECKLGEGGEYRVKRVRKEGMAYDFGLSAASRSRHDVLPAPVG